MIDHRNRNQYLQTQVFYLYQLLGNVHSNPYVEVTWDSLACGQRMDLHALADDKTVSGERMSFLNYMNECTNLGQKILGSILSYRLHSFPLCHDDRGCGNRRVHFSAQYLPSPTAIADWLRLRYVHCCWSFKSRKSHFGPRTSCSSFGNQSSSCRRRWYRLRAL